MSHLPLAKCLSKFNLFYPCKKVLRQVIFITACMFYVVESPMSMQAWRLCCDFDLFKKGSILKISFKGGLPLKMPTLQSLYNHVVKHLSKGTSCRLGLYWEIHGLSIGFCIMLSEGILRLQLFFHKLPYVKTTSPHELLGHGSM